MHRQAVSHEPVEFVFARRKMDSSMYGGQDSTRAPPAANR